MSSRSHLNDQSKVDAGLPAELSRSSSALASLYRYDKTPAVYRYDRTPAVYRYDKTPAVYMYPWATPRHCSHKGCVSAARFELGVGRRRKVRTGKVTKGLYFTYLVRSPTEAIYVKNCVLSDALDVITCATFHNEIFGGYSFTGGQIFHFPIDF